MIDKTTEKRGWFVYEEDDEPAPAPERIEDPAPKMWEEAERLKAELEADGEELDEDFLSETFLELDREYENEPPTDNEVALENLRMIQRQRDFQRAAEYAAEEFARLPEVLKVAAFGSVASPLKVEVPRFRKFRRAGEAIRHECGDLNLAVWVSRTGNLRALQIARGQAVNRLQKEEGINVAHHQVEVCLMEQGTGKFIGFLCNFTKCPKGKPGCFVDGCGKPLYLKLYEDFKFDAHALSAGRARVLFERKP